jgi:hypothetical protein
MIQLESKEPLFLQLSQRSSGEVNAVIANTAEAELMGERMNVQIAAWCHFYWRDTNPGADQFYRKHSDRAFSWVLLHKISKCTWDPSQKSAFSPRAMSEMSAIAKFKQQDWVKSLMQGNHSSSSKKKYVNPNVAFSFQDNFSINTIHGANLTPTISRTAPAASEMIKIADDNDKISILTLKSLAENGNLPPAEESKSEHVVRNRVASRSNQNPISSLTANATNARAEEDSPTASARSKDPTSNVIDGRADRGPNGKLSATTTPLNPQEGGLIRRQVDHAVGRGLQGTEGTSNVHLFIVEIRQPVGSDNYYLHVKK